MEPEKIARLVVPSLGNGAFQFPISPELLINIELNGIDEDTFDSMYQLFEQDYRMALTVLNTKCVIEGDFTHIEYRGRDVFDNINCLIKVNNITSFYYDANLNIED